MNELIAAIMLVVVTFVILQVLIGWSIGWWEVHRAPREPMFLCNVHGPIRKQNIVTFSDYEGLYTDIDGVVKDAKGDFDYCILCMHEKLKNAERIPKL